MQTNTHNEKIFLTHKTYPKDIRKLPPIQVLGSIRRVIDQKGQFLRALKEERGDKDHEEWVSCVPWGAVRQLSWGKCWEEWPHPHRSTVPPSLSTGVWALGPSRSGSPTIDNKTNTLGGQQLCNCSGRCLVTPLQVPALRREGFALLGGNSFPVTSELSIFSWFYFSYIEIFWGSRLCL